MSVGGTVVRALALIWPLGLYLCVCELLDYFLIGTSAEAVFRPKLGWRLLRWIAIAGCSIVLWQRFHGAQQVPNSPPAWVFLVLLFFWFFWPRTVLADATGVSSCGLFGFRTRSIPWSEVSRIASDWQEQRLTWNLFTPIWTFMGTSVTVIGRNGVRVQHGVTNQGQAAFLDALRRYLPSQVFDAGLYDWHPR